MAFPHEEVGFRILRQKIPGSQAPHVEIEAWILGGHVSLTDIQGFPWERTLSPSLLLAPKI